MMRVALKSKRGRCPSNTVPWPGWAEDLQEEPGHYSVSQSYEKSLLTLSKTERQWLHVQPWLEGEGYLLRPRFRAGWKPSWIAKKKDPIDCEDGIPHRDAGASVAIDAVRVQDGLHVCIKRIPTAAQDSTEVAITEFLSERQKQDSRNYAVPLLDILRVPDHCFIITPLYRTLEHGLEPLDTIGEGFDFVDQTLEGLAYLHKLQIAHRYARDLLFAISAYEYHELMRLVRDVTIGNVVMDGKRMFPHGFHMERPHRDERGRSLSGIRTRTQVGGVKYYYIDFGESMRFDSGGDIRIDVRSKANIHAPETRGADRPPYDPFKTDIYALGMTYTKFLLKDYEGNFDILAPLFNEMTSEDPALRPSAAQALSKFREIRSSFSRTVLHVRVHHDTTPETGAQRILRNSWHWLKQCTYAAHNLKW